MAGETTVAGPPPREGQGLARVLPGRQWLRWLSMSYHDSTFLVWRHLPSNHWHSVSQSWGAGEQSAPHRGPSTTPRDAAGAFSLYFLICSASPGGRMWLNSLFKGVALTEFNQSGSWAKDGLHAWHTDPGKSVDEEIFVAKLVTPNNTEKLADFIFPACLALKKKEKNGKIGKVPLFPILLPPLCV